MFNPAKASENIKNDYINFLTETFFMSDEEYKNNFQKILHKEKNISNGPFVNISLPFEQGITIDELCRSNILSKLFYNLEKCDEKDKNLPIYRKLYKHQVDAINVISTKKHNAIITTGTGSGKTECFLIPILNDLLHEKEIGTLSESGVRAILIYPMNALAHDQIKRLRNVLADFSDITFGVFNGNTKQTEAEALADYKELNHAEPKSNEFISRDKMIKTPPHILCTNYAMLEHMLLRPDDAKIFRDKKFKFVILDEAHVYSGATGMESALLLRRLKARIAGGNDVRFILTSATLGKKGENEEDIITFAKNLTGQKTFVKDDIIFGIRETPDFSLCTKNFDSKLFEELSNTEIKKFEEIFKKYAINYNNKLSPEENIFDLCQTMLLYKKLLSVEPLINVNDLSFKLNININDLINFLNIICLANKNGQPLIDLQYHFFIKGLEGAYSTLDSKKLYLNRLEKFDDKTVFERAVCKNCGHLGIAGVIKKENDYEYLRQNSTFEECEYFSIIDENYNENEDVFEEDMDENEENIKKTNKTDSAYIIRKLCPKCGLIGDENDVLNCCNVEPIKIINKNGTCRCGKCKSGNMRKIFINQEESTSILATSLFDNLPKKTISTIDEYGNEYDFDGGKQFLSFSDSRSDAAFFAPYLSNYQSEFIWKRAIVQALEQLKEEEDIDFVDLAKQVEKIFNKKENKSFSLILSKYTKADKSLAKQNAYAAIINELINSKQKGSLTSYGLIDFYIDDNVEIAKSISKNFDINYDICLKLLDYLIMFFAWNGCVYTDVLDDNPDLREYLFYTSHQKYITDVKRNSGPGLGWKSKNKDGEANKFYKNSRTEIVERVLKCDTKRANEFLNEYFNFLTNRNIIEQGDIKNFYFLPIEKIKIKTLENTVFYKCNKCGKITTHDIFGKCNEHNCDGDLIKTNSEELINKNFEIYKNNNLKHLLIKEHTAQLSKEEGYDYQKKFEKNEINALSCSTTFEMGVDVGKLETVFLRNIPPAAANYAQRAGRAGRSKDSAAYCLCYAKLSSHDYTFFDNPQKIIIGDIKPPIFVINNEKIVSRHIFAIILGCFFDEYSDYFDNNHALNFLQKGGYEQLKIYLASKPINLVNLLKNSIPEEFDINYEDCCTALVGNNAGQNGVLEKAVFEFNKNVEEIKKEYEKEVKKKLKGEKNSAEYYDKMLTKYTSIQMIEFLVNSNIIPKYGFPIDSVQLEIQGKRADKNLNLSRDLKLAISEYAPGEKIIANGQMYESRYINKMFVKQEGKKPTLAFDECKIGHCKCGIYNYFDAVDKTCIACGKEVKSLENALKPKRGFTSSADSSSVKMKKPEKIYSSQGHYIPDGAYSCIESYDINSKKIILSTTANDRIMTVSTKNFFVCPSCGYAVSDLDAKEFKDNKKELEKIKKNPSVFKIELKHKMIGGKLCANLELSKKKLIDVYNTDVVVMSFDDEEMPTDTETALSVLYALLDSISETLSIERNDIDGVLFKQYNETKSGFKLVFFDTVPGGAGNVKRLFGEETIKKIYKNAFDKLDKCECDKSCYRCLRNYSNQKYHNDLDKKLTLEFLKKFLTK